jgi:hypothetical protein
MGFLFPLVIIIYSYFSLPYPPSLSSDIFSYYIVVSTYLLAWTMLLATLLVRVPPVLTLRGVFSWLFILIAATLLTALHRWLGLGFILLMAGIWFGWGRQRWRAYFWVHLSFWIMIMVSGGGIALLAWKITPLWVNGLGLLSITLVLIRWAYRTGEEQY